MARRRSRVLQPIAYCLEIPLGNNSFPPAEGWVKPNTYKTPSRQETIRSPWSKSFFRFCRVFVMTERLAAALLSFLVKLDLECLHQTPIRGITTNGTKSHAKDGSGSGPRHGTRKISRINVLSGPGLAKLSYGAICER